MLASVANGTKVAGDKSWGVGGAVANRAVDGGIRGELGPIFARLRGLPMIVSFSTMTLFDPAGDTMRVHKPKSQKNTGDLAATRTFVKTYDRFIALA